MPYAPAAIYFEEDGYLETPMHGSRRARVRIGPIGRRVAGNQFLSAYVRTAQAGELFGLALNADHRKSMIQFCYEAGQGHRKLQVFQMDEFTKVFLKDPPVRAIHYPSPLESRFAWARQAGGGAPYALTGITHTISTLGVMQHLAEMVTSPFEPYDAQICISRAAVGMVKAMTDNFCSHLKDRFGGNPTFRPKLVHIPLGVDLERYRPPTPEERDEQRRKLEIADDEIVVLYLGRLIFHGKVHPFPIFQGVAGAAKVTGKRVRLIMAGWSPDPRILQAMKDGARTFAPHATITFVDGRLEEVRYRIWWAADIFAFPTDNIQETFPQSVLEAMASGLPVVASDWDGCRDQVVHGETGLLVPSYVVENSTADAATELLINEIGYEDFLARCNQTVTIDIEKMAAALATLFVNPELRARMGRAGRARAMTEFAWEKIVPRYESLWADLEAERQIAARNLPPPTSTKTPALFPPVEFVFGSYPARVLTPAEIVRSGPDARRRLEICMQHQLTGYGRAWRCEDPQTLADVLSAADKHAPLGHLEQIITSSGQATDSARATLAWLLKYGILERIPE